MATRKKVSPHASAGFTLIELLLSIAILSIIVVPVTTAFISALNNSSALVGSQNMMDSTRYALEYMSRQIRLPQRSGAIWPPTSPCASMASGTTYYQPNSSTLVFINSNSECVSFYLDTVNHKIKTTINGNGFNSIDLTSSSAALISALTFRVRGESNADSLQPIVTIELDAQGVSSGQAQGAVSHIETSVSSRPVDSP